jgi:hypothetical protein
MFIASHTDHSKPSDPGSPKNVMNISPGNALLVSAVAAILLLAGLSGTGTRVLTAPTNDYEHSSLSTPSVMGAQVSPNSSASAESSFRVRANEVPGPRSEIMDSYESVPSLAALAKQGKADARPVPAVAERHPLASSGVSP